MKQAKWFNAEWPIFVSGNLKGGKVFLPLKWYESRAFRLLFSQHSNLENLFIFYFINHHQFYRLSTTHSACNRLVIHHLIARHYAVGKGRV